MTLYLRQEQALELDLLSRNRHVAKAEVIRFALDRLLEEMRGGQLNLPLGVDAR